MLTIGDNYISILRCIILDEDALHGKSPPDGTNGPKQRIPDSINYKREFIGESFGTFILVLLGCGSVAVSVLFNAHQGLMQVALAWGISVTLATARMMTPITVVVMTVL